VIILLAALGFAGDIPDCELDPIECEYQLAVCENDLADRILVLREVDSEADRLAAELRRALETMERRDKASKRREFVYAISGAAIGATIVATAVRLSR
jgi:hypothetical protein